jgi:hypothetical protein
VFWLQGIYSLELSGRNLTNTASGEFFTNILQSIGTAAFDGAGKVTFTLTENTNSAIGTAVSFSGTYSLQADCIGTLNITQGQTASYTLGVFNTGRSYVMSGQNGTYSLDGGGNAVPASCSANTLIGAYSFSGSGFELQSQTISAVTYVSGVLQFDGVGAVTGNWTATPITPNLNPNSDSASGPYTVTSTSACVATAVIKDSVGNSYSVVFVITNLDGSFIVSVANTTTHTTQLLFAASGHPL